MPFRFTGMEQDRETGLIYYGARYLDPRMSRWLSTDPAMWEGDFIPAPGQGPGDLAGLGGVYNAINLHVFNYASNNPIRYVDPNGKYVEVAIELISIGLGIRSFIDNIRRGNVAEAIVDGAGVVIDTVALAIPLAPGIIGVSRQAARQANRIANSAENTRIAATVSEARPERITNPKHHIHSRSPEPRNVDELFQNSVRADDGTRWVQDSDGTLHRFNAPSNGQTHWNGSTAGRDPIQSRNIPPEIRNYFGITK